MIRRLSPQRRPPRKLCRTSDWDTGSRAMAVRCVAMGMAVARGLPLLWKRTAAELLHWTRAHFQALISSLLLPDRILQCSRVALVGHAATTDMLTLGALGVDVTMLFHSEVAIAADVRSFG